MKRLAIIAAFLFAAPFVAYAGCAKTHETVFSCVTAQKKHIDVCSIGEAVRYSFGKRNAKPEISVSVPKRMVSAESCYDCGRYISHSLYIPNGNTIYHVSWGGDRLSETGKTVGNIEVIVNDKQKANISCASEPIIKNLEGIEFVVPKIPLE